MADKLMYSPNNATQNYPFCRLFESFENLLKRTPTNKNSLKTTKLLSQRYYKFLGTSVINSPLPPPSLFLGQCMAYKQGGGGGAF